MCSLAHPETCHNVVIETPFALQTGEAVALARLRGLVHRFGALLAELGTQFGVRYCTALVQQSARVPELCAGNRA